MPQVKVSCTVENCVFHEKGNICGAEAIQVDMNKQLASSQLTEFAGDFDAKKADKKASDSSETCCNTFKAKNI